MIGPKTFEDIINQANNLGAMQASAIWALLCMVLAFILYRKIRNEEKASTTWRETREKAILAEQAQTTVVSRLVDVMAMNTASIAAHSTRIDHLVTILEERVPRKSP